ncbi:MAG: diguanylate cyclase [Deltaproteobacteria bacterium]|nr:diguanylate cyclase [Deltaproteobacteria bacterium]
MGIRLKLILLLTGLLVPLLGAGGLLNMSITRDTLIEEMHHRGLALLSALAVPSSIALANHEIERLDDYLAQLSKKQKSFNQAQSHDSQPSAGTEGDPVRDLVYLCVVNANGRVLAHTNETAYGTIRSDSFARRAILADKALFNKVSNESGAETLAVSLPVSSGLRWGTLLAEFSLERLNSRMARMQRHTIAITLVLIFLALLGLSIGLSTLVVSPVKALSKMAESLGRGDLSKRVTVRAKDEMGTLANVFNATAKELASYTHDLEQKIRERSAEIVEKNDQLEHANRRLSTANERLEEIATTDGLTGLANKTHWLTRLEFEVLRAKRGNHKLCLLMLDVDHFKNYNDSNGHLAGDRLLSKLAGLLTSNLRAIDIAGRFGGEEFGIALLDTSLRSGVRTADKIRQEVSRADFEAQASQPGGNLTVSIGVAELDQESQNMNDLIEKADTALYQAKNEGRNRVCS